MATASNMATCDGFVVGFFWHKHPLRKILRTKVCRKKKRTKNMDDVMLDITSATRSMCLKNAIS